MPKMKTNSSAKKRFTVTGSGKVKRAKAFKNHILTKKSTKRKRALGNDAIVDVTNMSNVKFMLRIGKKLKQTLAGAQKRLCNR